MKVRMRTTMAGPNGVYNFGEIADLPDMLVAQLIEHGYVEKIDLRRVEIETTEKEMKMERRGRPRKLKHEDDESIENV